MCRNVLNVVYLESVSYSVLFYGAPTQVFSSSDVHCAFTPTKWFLLSLFPLYGGGSPHPPPLPAYPHPQLGDQMLLCSPSWPGTHSVACFCFLKCVVVLKIFKFQFGMHCTLDLRAFGKWKQWG